MEIVGIDFGTTNVRISTWNPDDGGVPQPRVIGRGDTTVMPAVVALSREPGGSVSIVVGEDADELEENQETVVIRNIKRWALSNDPYVKWRLEVNEASWPTWWNPELRCVEVWGQPFQAKELMAEILKEALSRADLPGEFEWRAGCPVHAGLEYRSMLKDILPNPGSRSSINWVVDEPVLFLALARRMGNLDLGSYMVYDLGGGSFDCALVELREGGEMIVYGADGHPLLGGSNIDLALAGKLSVDNAGNLLRLAKEQVSPDNPTARISDNLSLTWQNVEDELKEIKYIQRSLMAMRDAYVNAKAVVWRREEIGDSSDEMMVDRDDDTGAVRFVWQLSYDDMERDLDGVILFGGPTRSPFFENSLRRWFGDEKVMHARDLVAGVDAPEITGVSMGACYFPTGEHFYDVPSRLPYRVTLENRQSGEKVEYSPYEYFVETFKPSEQFLSAPLQQARDNPQQYELTITDTDGVLMERQIVDGFLESEGRHPATSLRLVIDRLGPVYVEKKSEGIGLPWTKMESVVENPPWQTEEQRIMLEALRERERDREETRRQETQVNLERPAQLEVN